MPRTKRIKIRRDPAPPPTDVVVDKVTLLGLVDGTPNSVTVRVLVGRGASFQAETSHVTPPMAGDQIYARDPEAFDRVLDAILAHLVETGEIDGSVEE